MTIRELIHMDHPFNFPVRQGDVRNVMANMQDEMNKIFDHFFNGALVRTVDWNKKLPSAPAMDVSDTGKAFKVKIELEIADGILTLKGEKKDEQTEEGENYLRNEISYGSFYRTVALPETADSAKAEAKFKGGFLTVEVPKKAGAAHASKKLQIKKAA